MRSERLLAWAGPNHALPKTVREYHDRFKRLSDRLDEVPEVLDAVHNDLKKLSQGGRQGRCGDFSSDTILRSLLVMTLEGLSYRDTVQRIADSEFLQDFVRTRKKAVMDHSFLCRCLKAIEPKTWKRVNELLGKYAVGQALIEPSVVRADTTVVDSNIHYPTDSSLLWDVWRVASRLLSRARDAHPSRVPHRFHDRKIKRLHLTITRYSKSPNRSRKRLVKQAHRTLIVRVAWIVLIVEEFCRDFHASPSMAIQAYADQLSGYLPTMRKIVEQARRAKMNGETVPARERVFSLFEPHVELIQRGRRQKPIEFGHAMLLCQTAEKFISDYETYLIKPSDTDLTESLIDRHKRLFGKSPKVVAADKGFCPARDICEQLEERVETLAIPRRLRDFADKTLATWQAFRAGIEGTISGLKRAFRLARCYFRTFRTFEASIGLAVFSHNLLLLAKGDDD